MSVHRIPNSVGLWPSQLTTHRYALECSTISLCFSRRKKTFKLFYTPHHHHHHHAIILFSSFLSFFLLLFSKCYYPATCNQQGIKKGFWSMIMIIMIIVVWYQRVTLSSLSRTQQTLHNFTSCREMCSHMMQPHSAEGAKNFISLWSTSYAPTILEYIFLRLIILLWSWNWFLHKKKYASIKYSKNSN